MAAKKKAAKKATKKKATKKVAKKKATKKKKKQSFSNNCSLMPQVLLIKQKIAKSRFFALKISLY